MVPKCAFGDMNLRSSQNTFLGLLLFDARKAVVLHMISTVPLDINALKKTVEYCSPSL